MPTAWTARKHGEVAGNRRSDGMAWDESEGSCLAKYVRRCCPCCPVPSMTGLAFEIRYALRSSRGRPGGRRRGGRGRRKGNLRSSSRRRGAQPGQVGDGHDLLIKMSVPTTWMESKPCRRGSDHVRGGDAIRDPGLGASVAATGNFGGLAGQPATCLQLPRFNIVYGPTYITDICRCLPTDLDNISLLF